MQLPGPVRAVVGLLANAADEARQLPDRAIELPMLAISTALQMSMRAQQRYARLAARGDEVLNRRPPPDDPPPWAKFDEPVSVAGPPAPAANTAAAAKKPPAKKPPAQRTATARKAPARKKTVNRPRHADPSRFDIVGDD
jgi:hypothetical protein